MLRCHAKFYLKVMLCMAQFAGYEQLLEKIAISNEKSTPRIDIEADNYPIPAGLSDKGLQVANSAWKLIKKSVCALLGLDLLTDNDASKEYLTRFIVELLREHVDEETARLISAFIINYGVLKLCQDASGIGDN